MRKIGFEARREFECADGLHTLVYSNAKARFVFTDD